MKTLGAKSLITAIAVSLMAVGTVSAADKNIVDTAVGAGNFKTLAAALQAADLVDALKGDGPFTVFAPTDEAFAKLPKGTVETLLKPENKAQLAAILTYHVVAGDVRAKQVVSLSNAATLNGQRVAVKVEGGTVYVDNAKVLATDIACSNGTIHVIDQVILPNQENIPATAAKAGSFGTLLAAVEAAGLSDVISGDGPFTVFAPTDEAFDKLPKGTVESLLKPENKAKLAAIITYHVVSGRVYSGDALAAKQAKTVQGQEIQISIRSGKAMVNNASLLSTDIDASNGVIHVIDAVLLPPEKKQVGAAEGRRIIEHAVARGVRLYNDGHRDACAKLYAETARKMVGYGDQMPPLVMSSLTHALKECESTHCSVERAWALRRGLDRAY
ncbi:MAG: transforming growth factor-beta-induced protein, partial [Pirellulaceae bacterium]